MTREDEIATVHGGKRHTVLLGAGASYALSLRNPEKGGKALPLMANLIDVLELNNIVEKLPQNIQDYKTNFEKLYSELILLDEFEEERMTIESRIYDYFQSMRLPDAPTIYDYLILSLRRQKDIIATFNWDPFLFDAFQRNYEYVESPNILFLHGNVRVGFDAESRQAGPVGMYSRSGKEFIPTKLLFPVEQKDYNSDHFIQGQWETLKNYLDQSSRVTVFGYSAPKTDVEAIELLQEAWGSVDHRNMEQFEFIDIQEEETLLDSWKTFVHTHHYNYCNSFFESSLALHPRRTVESYNNWAMPMSPDDMFQDGNKIPEDFETLEELWEWHNSLIEAEKKYYDNE